MKNPRLNPLDEQNAITGEWHGCHSKNIFVFFVNWHSSFCDSTRRRPTHNGQFYLRSRGIIFDFCFVLSFSKSVFLCVIKKYKASGYTVYLLWSNIDWSILYWGLHYIYRCYIGKFWGLSSSQLWLVLQNNAQLRTDSLLVKKVG